VRQTQQPGSDIAITNSFEKGVVAPPKDCVELVRVLVIEMNISGVNALWALLPTDSISLVWLEISTTEIYDSRI